MCLCVGLPDCDSNSNYTSPAFMNEPFMRAFRETLCPGEPGTPELTALREWNGHCQLRAHRLAERRAGLEADIKEIEDFRSRRKTMLADAARAGEGDNSINHLEEMAALRRRLDAEEELVARKEAAVQEEAAEHCASSDDAAEERRDFRDAVVKRRWRKNAESFDRGPKWRKVRVDGTVWHEKRAPLVAHPALEESARLIKQGRPTNWNKPNPGPGAANSGSAANSSSATAPSSAANSSSAAAPSGLDPAQPHCEAWIQQRSAAWIKRPGPRGPHSELPKSSRCSVSAAAPSCAADPSASSGPPDLAGTNVAAQTEDPDDPRTLGGRLCCCGGLERPPHVHLQRSVPFSAPTHRHRLVAPGPNGGYLPLGTASSVISSPRFDHDGKLIPCDIDNAKDPEDPRGIATCGDPEDLSLTSRSHLLLNHEIPKWVRCLATGYGLMPETRVYHGSSDEDIGGESSEEESDEEADSWKESNRTPGGTLCTTTQPLPQRISETLERLERPKLQQQEQASADAGDASARPELVEQAPGAVHYSSAAGALRPLSSLCRRTQRPLSSLCRWRCPEDWQPPRDTVDRGPRAAGTATQDPIEEATSEPGTQDSIEEVASDASTVEAEEPPRRSSIRFRVTATPRPTIGRTADKRLAGAAPLRPPITPTQRLPLASQPLGRSAQSGAAAPCTP